LEHADTTRLEFTHQADAMSGHRLFTSGDVVDWFRDSVVASRGALVLDLACGPGIISAALAPYAQHVSGVDLTPRMIEHARERCSAAGLTNTEFQEASAEHLPFSADRFDSVVTRLSFHHFTDVPAVLSEIRRVLKPEGRLLIADIISSPNPAEAGLQDALENLRDPSHVRMLPETELVQMVQSAGFSIQSVDSLANEREFSEWAAIVSGARSLDSLEVVMRRLAENGVTAGIGLRTVNDGLFFDHHWRLVTAQKVFRSE